MMALVIWKPSMRLALVVALGVAGVMNILESELGIHDATKLLQIRKDQSPTIKLRSSRTQATPQNSERSTGTNRNMTRGRATNTTKHAHIANNATMRSERTASNQAMATTGTAEKPHPLGTSTAVRSERTAAVQAVATIGTAAKPHPDEDYDDTTAGGVNQSQFAEEDGRNRSRITPHEETKSSVFEANASSTSCTVTVAVCIVGHLMRLEADSKRRFLVNELARDGGLQISLLGVLQGGASQFANKSSGTVPCWMDEQSARAAFHAAFGPNAVLNSAPSRNFTERMQQLWTSSEVTNRTLKNQWAERLARSGIQHLFNINDCAKLVLDRELRLARKFDVVVQIRDNSMIMSGRTLGKQIRRAASSKSILVQRCSGSSGCNDDEFYIIPRDAVESGMIHPLKEFVRGAPYLSGADKPETVLKQVWQHHGLRFGEPLQDHLPLVVDVRCIKSSTQQLPPVMEFVSKWDGRRPGQLLAQSGDLKFNEDPTRKQLQVHVITWKRPRSLKTLLEQLTNQTCILQCYPFPVPVFIHVDGGADERVHRVARDFDWPYGDVHLDFRTKNVGLRDMWMTSLTQTAQNAHPNTLMLVVEDDIRLSPRSFEWMDRVVNTFSTIRGDRDSSWMGISLSPVRVDEMRKPFKRWHAPMKVGKGNQAQIYLSTLPSSWGVAYWSDRWLEFARFYELRRQESFFNQTEELRARVGVPLDELRMTPPALLVPDARSNVWPFSWKRFMVDFMVGRGLVMLYPNLPNESGLATTLQLQGEHISNGNIKHSDSDVGEPNNHHLEKNSRVAPLWRPSDVEFLRYAKLTKTVTIPNINNRRQPVEREMPLSFLDLKVLTIHMAASSRMGIALQGLNLLRQIMGASSSYAPLVARWSRPGWLNSSHLGACAPDIFWSAGNPAATTSGERYLLYEPQYGMNNQLFTLCRAAVWAVLLGRTLVVPPLLLPRASEYVPENDTQNALIGTPLLQIFDVDQIFDAIRTRLNMPLRHSGHAQNYITWEIFKEMKVLPTRKLSSFSQAVYDSDESRLQDSSGWSIPTISTLDSNEMGYTFSHKKAREYFGGCGDQVLFFDNMFKAHIKGLHEFVSELQLLLQLQARVQKLVYSVKQTLLEKLGAGDAGYSCVHVRLGDFVEVCKDLIVAAKQNRENSRPKEWVALVNSGYRCTKDVTVILSTVKSLGLPAIILTDDPTALEEASAWKTTVKESSGISIAPVSWTCREVVQVMSSWGWQWSNNTLMTMCAVVEQQLCIGAKKVKLSKMSTFSQRICIKRGCSSKDYF